MSISVISSRLVYRLIVVSTVFRLIEMLSASFRFTGSTKENGDTGGGGLSKSDQIALGAGISGGILALVGVIIA